MAFAVWITGLSGSGKSTIASAFLELSKKNKISAAYLNMDSLRKRLIKNPNYMEKERGTAYKKFAVMGILECKKGKNVIFDATAHKIKYRNYARRRIKNFIEVYAKCPLNACIRRETKRKGGKVMAGIYMKALERKSTGKNFAGLGNVIGIDVPYEENRHAEITIDSLKTTPAKAARIIFDFLKTKNKEED